MTIKLLQESDINEALSQQIHDLFKQLNAEIRQLDIKNVLQQGNDFICACCWEDTQLLGMASLATYKVISGYKGMVEDVVVSTACRGKGIGKKLMQSLIDEGEKRQLKEIILFSNHHRKPAIQLYKSLGFNLKESGMYTLKL